MTKKALVTGLSGFTGIHLKNELEKNGYRVFGLNDPQTGKRVDIRDEEAVSSLIKSIVPDAVFHLASQTLASLSWQKPRETMEINGVGPICLLEALRANAPEASILLVGSSDQYGLLGGECESVTEETPLSPKTPYAASKCMQEYIGKLYAGAYNMRICMTRTFSIGGKGQRKGLVLSDFASGIAAVEAGLSDALHVGNLDSERDFSHVEDVCRAYRLISEMGVPGEAYNVGSGQVHSIKEVLEEMKKLAACEIPVIQAVSKKRPRDVRGAPCCHDKLTSLTGWTPERSFSDMIADELNDWREQTRLQIKN